MEPCEILNRSVAAYARVSGKIREQIEHDIGFKTGHLDKVLTDPGKSISSFRVVMGHVAANWPRSHVQLSLVRDFARQNADIVSASRKAANPRPKVIKCLRCRSEIRSEGPHHRLCGWCSGKGAGLPAQMQA